MTVGSLNHSLFFSCRSCVVCKAFLPFQIGPLSPPPPLPVTTRRRWTTAAHCPITFQFWPKSTRNNLVCVSATQHTTPQHHNTTTYDTATHCGICIRNSNNMYTDPYSCVLSPSRLAVCTVDGQRYNQGKLRIRCCWCWHWQH